ncbi:hypothetical protein HPB47_027076 [Ixodes persulcatus]|uniref:Uncharacterized protein n=1 Tax=Ixodes persulcatus TaxID=34615 RepID=A0AC60PYB2_IXOPE|nr:hypothetical protein HPB47_027076 [Ixodes persulcatus]
MMPSLTSVGGPVCGSVGEMGGKPPCVRPVVVPLRPPSQSLNSYGTADDVRSPTGSAGTPGPMPQQPSSQQSTDNNSEAVAAREDDMSGRD